MIKSTEVVIECPECDNTSLQGRYNPNCYVNIDKGTWICHRCKAKGHISQLDPAALEEPVTVVEKKEQLDTSVIQSFTPLQTYEERFPGIKLPPGLLYTTADKANLAIVGRDWGNKIVSIKYRTLRGEKSYIAEPGSEIGKFFLPVDKELETKERKILIVEGELDAITARILGFPGDILALQTTSMKDDAAKYVRRRYNHIYIGLDNDESGNTGTKEIQKLLQFKDHTVLQYPTECKDINEILLKKGPIEAERWLRRETSGDFRDRIVTGAQVFKELYASMDDIQSTPAVTSGFMMLDSMLGGGLREGELTIVHAKAKTGKTTFLNQIIAKSILADIKVGVASFEMNPVKEILPSVFSIIMQKNFRQSAEASDLIKATQGNPGSSELFNPVLNLTFFNHHLGKASLEGVIQFIEELAHSGTKLICVDHTLFLVKSAKESDEHVEVCRQLALAANRYKVHIILVAQAPKLINGMHLGLETPYGGMAASMFAHNFITLQRAKEHQDVLEVRLLACRYPNSRPSYEPVMLTYNRETCSLTE